MRNRSIQGAIALLALACNASLAQGIYRCEGPAGMKVYQQAPCAGGEELTTRRSRASAADAAAQQKEADASRSAAQAEDQRLAAVSPGINGHFPVVGMTRTELKYAIGEPDQVNVSDYGRGLEEQRIYGRGDRTLVVYTKRGQVTSIQDAERGAAPKRTQPCPSPAAVRNAYTAANSGTLTEKERELQLKRAREMEQCR